MKRHHTQLSGHSILTDDHINEILLLCGQVKTPRKRKLGMANEYCDRLHSKANKCLSDWKANGVPADIWIKMSESASTLVSLFNLIKKSSLSENGANIISTPRNILQGKRQVVPPIPQSESVIIRKPLTTIAQLKLMPLGYNLVWIIIYIKYGIKLILNYKTLIEQLFLSSNLSECSSSEEESGYNEEPALYLREYGSRKGTGVSFIKLLRHFSVLTDQKKSHLTKFLRLLHHHKPVIDYDSLPTTGEVLLAIDGRDFPPVKLDTLPALEEEVDQPNSMLF